MTQRSWWLYDLLASCCHKKEVLLLPKTVNLLDNEFLLWRDEGKGASWMLLRGFLSSLTTCLLLPAWEGLQISFLSPLISPPLSNILLTSLGDYFGPDFIWILQEIPPDLWIKKCIPWQVAQHFSRPKFVGCQNILSLIADLPWK